MRSPDTHPAAHEAQLDAYRRMSAAQKANVVASLSGAVRQLAAEGIRRRHPEYDERDVQKALLALLYGADLVQRLWPKAKVLAP
jgi:hypothetical protein